MKKLKKFFITILAFLLFLGTTGPSLYMHYCGGKLYSFSFVHKPNHCCNGSCRSCKDVSAFYKIKDNFEKQAKDIITPSFSEVAMVLPQVQDQLIYSPVKISFTNTQPPPLNRSSFLFTEVFRI